MENNLNNLQEWFKKYKGNDSNDTDRFSAFIEMEKQIGEQIYNALQGSVVEEVLRKTKVSSADTYWRSTMEGHSLKVEKELLSDFYDLCHEVKSRLKFDEKVDFYITGDSSVNAFSVAAENEGEPHIVNINSALFGLMSSDELRFVVGHELGHLINKDTALARLINFVFPPNAAVPVTLQYKIRLHEQLAELVADRYGYMAVGNLDVCVTAFFKLASGLDLSKMNVSIDALIADNNRRLDFFLNDNGVSRASHPVNPIRVQALNLFATANSKAELDKGMDELISILLKVGSSELDEYTARFIASAGLLVANLDGQIYKEEAEQVIQSLAGLKIFPRKYLDEIAQGNVMDIFNETVGKILEINPSMRDSMLDYLIHIVLSDKIIAKEEVDLLYRFGSGIGFSDIEVATAIAGAIQRCYVPSLDAIC
ncbi:MAG: M48 family metalloprotease [Bacteroidaceae bacterium]|nr:M48 family metalloprotease [Bacteroidaceae bacterium]